jgi:hypothetical protein
MTIPYLDYLHGVYIVRDDLYPGGTKARFLPGLYDDTDEIVYASPPQGGAQTALAWVARALGKRATIFGAARAVLHPRQRMAIALGATFHAIRPGYLGVVQKRARDYCDETGATLAPFGFATSGATSAIATAALSAGIIPDEVWCAAGSGTLARGLRKAWPMARLNMVQIGRDVADVAGDIGARLHIHDRKFEQECAAHESPPFPSCPHYDAKVWNHMMTKRGPGTVLMWNVTRPAQSDIGAEWTS